MRRFDREIAEFTQSRKHFMRKLRNTHEREIIEFNEHWTNPASLKAYTKASPQLLQLREIERRKVLLMDYDGADTTRQVADRTEEAETAAARERLQRGMALQLAQMQRRHQMEIDAAERFAEKKLCHLRNERNAVVIPLQKQLMKAEKREERVPDVIRAISSRGPRCRSPRYEGDDIDLAPPKAYGKLLKMRLGTGARSLRIDSPTAGSPKRAQSARRNSARASPLSSPFH
jgi:hypothetical protein